MNSHLNHLNHRQLLAYLDGELSKSETRKAAVHLQSCWTCRTAAKRLEGDIACILDAQNEVLSPALPPPPRPWPALGALLARNLPPHPPFPWKRVAESIDPLFGSARILAASCCLIALMILTDAVLRSNPVSAQEVLHRVRIADGKRAFLATGQVLRERVRIRERARRRSAPETEEVDAWKSSAATYWDTPAGDSAGADLEAKYKAFAVPMDLPLSAASIEDWGKAAGGNPTISRRGKDLGLSFAGPAQGGEGSVERVNLLIEPETWRVKEMSLQFPDASFEVAEDDLSHLPVSEVPSEFLVHLRLQAAAQKLLRHAAEAAPRPMVGSIHPRTLDLSEVALDVFATLHSLNADLGEPVTISRSKREVQVGLWQLSDDRQRQLSRALQGKPGVQVQMTAPANSMLASNRTAVALPNPPLRVVANPANEDQQLAKLLGGAPAAEAFTHDALNSSTAILAHLYALRNLQEQFPPAEEKALPSDRRARLAAIVEDHATAASAGLRALETRLAPLDAAFHVSWGGFPEYPVAASWQNESLDALATAKIMDHWLRSLLTDSDAPVSAATGLPQVQRNLSRLSAQLESLNAATR